jgi:hypothetical protein
MKKVIIIIVFSCCIVPLKAQFLYDTLKYVKFYDKPLWSLYQNFYSNSFLISQNYVKDSLANTTLNINAESVKEVGISYAKNQYFVAINLFGILNEQSGRKPKPRYANGVGSFSDRDYLVECGFNWFTGYFDKNSKNINPKFNDSLPYYDYGKLRSLNTFFNYVHFNNYKNFSYNAAYKGLARQKRSALSGLYFANVNYNRMESDSAIVPYSIRGTYREQGQTNKLFNTYFAFGIGASGTLVLFKSFFVNLTLMGGPGFQAQHYSLKTKSGFTNGLGVLFYGDTRFAFGVNLKRFIIYSASTVQFKYYTVKKLNFTNTFFSNTFSVGYRFNQRKSKY